MDLISGLHALNAILGIGVDMSCLYIVKLFRGGVFERSYYHIFLSGVFFFAHCVLHIFFGIFFPQPWFNVVYALTETMFIATFLYGTYSFLRSWTRLGKQAGNHPTSNNLHAPLFEGDEPKTQ